VRVSYQRNPGTMVRSILCTANKKDKNNGKITDLLFDNTK